MDVEQELSSIESQLTEIQLKLADDGVMGELDLGGERASSIKRLRLEAQAILDKSLGVANNFSMSLRFSTNSGGNLTLVHESLGIIQGAINHIRRGGSEAVVLGNQSKVQYVDQKRISELNSLVCANYDLRRLIRLCEELNISYTNGAYMSVAMLLRALIDHVPPLFGLRTFDEVANNYRGSTSFKRSMRNFQGSLRNIADLHLHEPVRGKEVLPTIQQVDFRSDLDVLLGEIVRLFR